MPACRRIDPLREGPEGSGVDVDRPFQSVHGRQLDDHRHAGRVVLAGDAAHAPSFLSGQGTSLALVGAYVLAGELAIHEEPEQAFAAYEQICRPFVEANQALATRGGSLLLPASAEELESRNRWLAETSGSAAGGGAAIDRRTEHNLLKLPDYAGVN
jgi:2-polyprenyl-6-methoxyphenol hydroxylase-like FAD-dependent oxidoreductase